MGTGFHPDDKNVMYHDVHRMEEDGCKGRCIECEYHMELEGQELSFHKSSTTNDV